MVPQGRFERPFSESKSDVLPIERPGYVPRKICAASKELGADIMNYPTAVFAYISAGSSNRFAIRMG